MIIFFTYSCVILNLFHQLVSKLLDPGTIGGVDKDGSSRSDYGEDVE